MVAKSMGVMDKFLNYMKLNGEEDDDYLDEDYLDDGDDLMSAPPQRKLQGQKSRDEDELEERAVKRTAPANKITPIKQPSSRRAQSGSGMEVCVIKPTSVEDAREITETLLANRTVVLNLEGLDVDIAQRIIDLPADPALPYPATCRRFPTTFSSSRLPAWTFREIFRTFSGDPLKCR